MLITQVLPCLFSWLAFSEKGKQAKNKECGNMNFVERTQKDIIEKAISEGKAFELMLNANRLGITPKQFTAVLRKKRFYGCGLLV